MSETTTNLLPSRPKNQVDLALKQIDEIHSQGVMPDDVYYKVMVCLAYEYIQADDHQMGFLLINRCPPEYFEKTQVLQMQEDPSYRDVVVLMAYKLIQLGVVTGDTEVFKPTQAGAKA